MVTGMDIKLPWTLCIRMQTGTKCKLSFEVNNFWSIKDDDAFVFDKILEGSFITSIQRA